MKPIALITGASSGIGAALASELARKGYTLALAARRKERLDDLKRDIERGGGDVLTLVCDVSEQAEVKRAVEETLTRFGRIDLAILSAGIGGPTRATSFKADGLKRLLDTNLLGVAYCLEELIPVMLKQQSGVLAAISSLAGDRGMPGSASYCATKAALSTLFDGLRIELKPHGIRLVTIEPGYVITPMTEGFGKMPMALSAQDAAALIARRIEAGDRVIRFPHLASAFMRLMRVLPVSLFDAIVARRRPVRLD